MDIEEVRRRKGEAEERIKEILNRYIEDTNTNTKKIMFTREPLKGHIYEITNVIIEVEL
jgi:hypothetical protein